MNDYEYLKSMMEDGIIQLSTEEKMKLLNTCNICYENQQLYVFNKCGHTCCKSCFYKLNNVCHICKIEILNKMKLFL